MILKNQFTDFKSGLIELKNDKDGNLGATIGRKSFSSDNLINNFNHLVDFLKKEKPDTIKGEVCKKYFLTSTMGISYKTLGKNLIMMNREAKKSYIEEMKKSFSSNTSVMIAQYQGLNVK